MFSPLVADLARFGPAQPEEAFDQLSLPRARDARDADDLALFHREADVLDLDDAVVALDGQILHGQQVLADLLFLLLGVEKHLAPDH